MSEALFMVRAYLDTRKVHAAGHARGLTRDALDLGYVAHCGLREIFGDGAPKPFVTSVKARGSVEVLGYTPRSLAELKASLDPGAAARYGLDTDTLEAKKMPAAMPRGARFRFQVRVCPVVRKSSDGPVYASGAEIDAFLAEVEKAVGEAPVSREAVYKRWLSQQLQKGGAECKEASLVAFRQTRLVRRNRERQAHTLTRPDVTAEGVLEVTDETLFQRMLRQGIGRHRAFGFGMLLLKR